MTEQDRALLRETREVEIETSRGDGASLHRTIIWVVVDDTGRIFVRTFLGPQSRWYREALANPRVRLLAGGQALNVTVERADDPERIAACSEGLRAKYRRGASLDAMLRDDVLDTTLELRPADE